MSDTRTLLEEVIVQTADDWSDAVWIVGLAAAATNEAPGYISRALDVIIDGLGRGLLVAGDFTGPEFEPWPEPTDEVIARISRAWAALGGREPEPDSIAWFDLTPAGEVLAAEIRARESRDEA